MIDSIESAKEFIYSFVNYERRMPPVYNTSYFDLVQFAGFLRRLGNPHECYPCIHVAGTKGKGSTSAMLAAILRESGYRTGLYHSPHLRDTRERIQIDGVWIPEKDFINITGFLRDQVHLYGKFDRSYRTTFELLTALGLIYFRDSKIDVAVIETGLGGRLDATNVISPAITVITRIGKDHTHLLGNTLESIALEKAGIIKPGIPVVTGKQHHRAMKVLVQETQKRKAHSYDAEKLINLRVTGSSAAGTSFRIPTGKMTGDYFLNLGGLHQLENLKTALCTLDVAGERFPGVTPGAILTALKNLVWPGRFQIIESPGLPMILLDVAHNPDSFRQLVKSIRRFLQFRDTVCILALSRGKQVRLTGKILASVFSRVILCAGSTPRTIPPEELHAQLEGVFEDTMVAATPGKAFRTAVEIMHPKDLLCITGSFYLVGDILNMLDNTADPPV